MARSERTDRRLWVTHEVDRTEGGDARRRTIAAGKAVAAAVRTTLGPKGMDKMLVGSDGTVVVTNDGASVLDRLDVADPVARVLVDVAATQDDAVGDGTTTAVLLTGELLAAAESLFDDGLHPTTVVAGYRRAAARARERLDAYGVPVDPGETERLRDVARTAVTGKWDDDSADRFADLAVSAVRAVESNGRVDVRQLGLEAYSGGQLRESELVDGLLVDLETSSTTVEAFDVGLPRSVTDARVALVDHEVAVGEADAVERATVADPDQFERLRAHEDEARTNAVRIVTDLGVDVLCCQKSVDDAVRGALAREGVLAVERTRQDELDALARATGATPVHSVDDLGPDAVGRAGSIERRSVGETQVIAVTDCPCEERATLLLRGGTEHVADETRRVVEDCVSVVQLAIHEGTVLPGGGAIEVALARDLSSHAESVGGREQLAVAAFGEALEGVPRTLASNAGRSPVDALVALRRRHYAGEHAVGIDASGGIRDMVDAGVLEPRLVVDRCLSTALETVAMALRVDDAIETRASGDDPARGHHDARGGEHAHGDAGGYPWAIGH